MRRLIERPYLRPYFYDGAEWKAGDAATRDEVQVMAELILNNFEFTARSMERRR